MRYGIEVNGRLFETDDKRELPERLGTIRQFYSGFVDESLLPEFVKPVKIYANGKRVAI